MLANSLSSENARFLTLEKALRGDNISPFFINRYPSEFLNINMSKFFQELFTSFSKNPTVTFMMITIAAVFYLYNDLSKFISQQQQLLTQQVKTQQETTDLLNQISQRIAEIELKIYNSSQFKPIEDNK